MADQAKFQFQYTILSIDGGGIRGIIPAVVLVKMEELVRKMSDNKIQHLAEVFDLIAGTSTGGILAAGLTLQENGRPKYTAEQLLRIYTGPKKAKQGEEETLLGDKSFMKSLRKFNGKKIFRKRLGPFSLDGWWFGSKFSAVNIEKVLDHYFGVARLKDAYTKLLITSYDTEIKKPFYFFSGLTTNDKGEEVREENFLMKDLIRATSAAPTYFPPKKISEEGILYENQTRKYLSLVDGGVFANNPSVLAYVHAREEWKKETGKTGGPARSGSDLDGEKGTAAVVHSDNFDYPFLMVSIGTGKTKRIYPHKSVRWWWKPRWIQPLIDILMQGVSESVNYEMEFLLPKYEVYESGEGPHIKYSKHPRYFRLNVDLPTEFSAIDDVSNEYLQKLEEIGWQLVEDKENLKTLRTICSILTETPKAIALIKARTLIDKEEE